MNELFKNKLYNFIFLAVIVIFIFVLLNVSLIPLSGTDVWRHIYMGKLIIHNKTLSFNEDPLLFVSKYKLHNKVYSLNWLFQVIVYLVYKLSGFIGLCFFQLLIAFITFYYFIKSCKYINVIGILLFVFTAAAYQCRVEIRPHLISYMFMSIFIYSLWNTDILKPKIMIFLIILQILWSNIHIYFFMGPMITLMYLGEKIIYKELPKETRGKVFGLVIVLSIVSLINPMGWLVYKDVLGAFSAFFSDNSYFVIPDIISELKSPFKLPYFYKNIYIGSIIVTIISFILVYIYKKKKKYIFVFLFFLFFSFYSIRSAIIYIILSPIFFINDIKIIIDILKEKNKFILINIFGIVLFFILFFLSVSIPLSKALKRFSNINKLTLELKTPILNNLTLNAVNFINQNNDIIPKKLFTTYNNGSAYTFFTGRKAFMDSRGTSPKFFKEYEIISNPIYIDKKSFAELLDKFGIEGFVINTKSINLIRKIHLDKRFEPIYIDKQVIIFTKKDSVSSKRLNIFKSNFKNNINNIMTETKNASQINLSLVNVALALAALDRTDTSIDILKKCENNISNNPTIYYNLGVCYLKTKDYNSAFKYFKKTLEINDNNKRALVGAYISSYKAGLKDVSNNYNDILKKKMDPVSFQKIIYNFKFIGINI